MWLEDIKTAIDILIANNKSFTCYDKVYPIAYTNKICFVLSTANLHSIAVDIKTGEIFERDTTISRY